MQPSFLPPPLCTGLFHPGQRRVPTSSSCLHNNPQLFYFFFARLRLTPRFHPRASAVRQIHAGLACASLDDQTTERSHRPHVRPFFLSTIRAIGACAYWTSTAQPRRPFSAISRKTGGKGTRLRDGDPAQNCQNKAGAAESSVKLHSTSPTPKCLCPPSDWRRVNRRLTASLKHL